MLDGSEIFRRNNLQTDEKRRVYKRFRIGQAR
jgi:hypothetical protein